MWKLFLYMVGMEFFYGIKLCTLIIRITRKRIDKGVDFSYFRYIRGMEVSIRARWSPYKKSTVLEKISNETIFTHGTVTNITVSDIHRILGKKTISHREGNLLVPYHKPWVMPEVVIIGYESPWYDEEYSPCPEKGKIRDKIDHKCDRSRDKKHQFQRCEYWHDPVLVSFIEYFFLETKFWHMRRVLVMTSVTRTMSMIIMSSMVIISMVITMTTSSHFVELYTIAGIFFFPIKSNIREVIPDREKCCVDKVGKEKLVEHQDDPERDDHILVTHDIRVICWFSDIFLVKKSITYPGQDVPYMKYITLLDHIDRHSTHSKDEKTRNSEKYERIECRMCRLRNNESTMKRKKYHENPDEIECDWNEKYRKT